MILLAAILIGLIFSLIRSKITHRELQAPALEKPYLVAIAFLPQALVFSYSPTRTWFSSQSAAVVLTGSMVLLLYFAWINLKQPGFWALGAGLLLNFSVIVLNGGLMPISPETLLHRSPNIPEDAWHIGERLGFGKDIVLPEIGTRLAWLSDRFVSPPGLPYRVAFSLGDIFIAIGAFWMLWSSSKPPDVQLAQ